MKDRLTELEIKTSLTEDLVEVLNRTVFRQQEQIDLLQAQLRHLYGQLGQMPKPPRMPSREICAMRFRRIIDASYFTASWIVRFFFNLPTTCISQGLQSKRRVSFSLPLIRIIGSGRRPLTCLGHRLKL